MVAIHRESRPQFSKKNFLMLGLAAPVVLPFIFFNYELPLAPLLGEGLINSPNSMLFVFLLIGAGFLSEVAGTYVLFTLGLVEAVKFGKEVRGLRRK